jgi:signal transduction histidine kinase
LTGAGCCVEAPRIETPEEALQETLDRLLASRRRLVVAADADRRRIERDLHDGPQQHLVALAVNLQLAAPLVDSDPEAAKALLEEIERDVRQALDETRRLARRIYTPLGETGGLAAALRSAAVTAGVAASVDVAAPSRRSAEVDRTVLLCWLAALEAAGAQARPAIVVRDEDGALTFEIVGEPVEASALRDRVAALGGELTIRREAGGVRVSGRLPI